ncbi:hypothetical protein PVAP13_6KG214100 [Panicum virgatum]|nr:hypothetical protein PVAP13_6KG214100 [Panicum virgatum]
MSAADLPALGGPPPAGQTPYLAQQKNPPSQAAPSNLGTQNPRGPNTLQPPYQPAEKRNKNGGKKHSANGMSRDVKY